ncbi:hypothetical protein ACEPAI_9287 [Sanghuangporus weigelae]
MPVLAHDVYTNQTGEGPYVIFPTHAHQILSNCTHIFGVSVLAFCFARRTDNDRFTSWLWWSNLTWARLLIILIFLDSWIFLAFSGILVNGVGLSYSTPVCSLGIFGCIFFYATSKALTYLFLVERVWVVCSAGKSITRLESRIYRGCALVVFGYTAIITDLIIGRYAQIRDDGVCMIGLHSFATIPLLTYDLFINIFLTSMFLWFLYREQSISERLRRLARRTAFAAAIALTISCVNILILALLKGKQLGWVCLSSCAADVTVNALVLFWVTGGASRDPYWHGAFEIKDGAVFVDPHELPPLNFPVSFDADPEMGPRTMETGPVAQQQTQIQTQNHAHQSRSLSARFVSLGESMREKEFCEGSSKDGLSEHERRRGTEFNSDDDDDDKRSAVMEEIEWDITDSASSNKTHYSLEDRDSGKCLEDDATLQSWRLTLDLELQRPSLLSPDRPEPDSPATHETAGSRTRLTSRNPLTQQLSVQPEPAQKRRNEFKKQRRRHWSARARRGPSQSRSLQRPASSPTIPRHPNHPPLHEASGTDPLSLTSDPAPYRPKHQYVLRSHSDSLMRMRVSDLSMFPGRPRLSQ